jgi:hypothetical protein
MNIACYLRRSAIARVIALAVREAFSGLGRDVPLPRGLGLPEESVIVSFDLLDVLMTQDAEANTRSVWPAPYFFTDIGITLRLGAVVVVNDRVGGGVGGSPQVIGISFDIPYLLSMRQPLDADAPESPSNLLLESARIAARGVAFLPRVGSVLWTDAFERGQDPPWVQQLSTAFQEIQVGALLPPISAQRLLTARTGGELRPARLLGDEVHFGSLPLLLAASVTTRTLETFLALPPQLSEDEDIAVEVGAVASTLFCAVLATGAASGIAATLATGPLSIAGGAVRVALRDTSPPVVQIRSAEQVHLPLPLRTWGLCRAGATFPFQTIDINLALDATASLQVGRGFGPRAAPSATLSFTVVVDADLNQGDVSDCSALLSSVTFGVGGIVFGIASRREDDGLEARFTFLIASSPLVPPVLAQWGAMISVVGEENFVISAPIQSSFGGIGPVRVDPQTVRASSRGVSYRIGGGLQTFDDLAPAGADALLIRDVVSYFPLLFAPSFSLIGGLDCESRAPSAISFAVWNRSRLPVTIRQFDVRSVDWERLEASGSVQWLPARDQPVTIPPWGTLRVRCEFTSIEALNETVNFSAAAGSFAELVVLVLSDRPPLIVRWDDPLRRLRTLTPADIERAREACRLGPISSPWEIIRRPREFDLFPEFQPFWREDLSRLTPRDIQTQLPESSLPWEDSSQVTFTDEARLDAGPGVFAILMQSAARRR